jgi:hypothetical protein
MGGLTVVVGLVIGERSASAALFANFAQAFLESFDGVYSTALDYENVINHHWVLAFGNWLIGDIGPQHVKAELSKRKTLSLKTRKISWFRCGESLCSLLMRA